MDNSITAQLKRHRLHTLTLNHSKYHYLLSTLLPVAATALIFFLPYYFITALQFSLLQAGLLISFYGSGIFIAIVLTPYLNTRHSPRKIILFSLCANCVAIAYFLYAENFFLLSFNLILLGFAGYCFKKSYSHLLLQYSKNDSPAQTKIAQHSYIASNIGLGLAMLAIALFAINNFKILFMSAFILNALPLLFLPRDIPSLHKLRLAPEPAPMLPDIFSLILLFLGGLILSQVTATYGIYLSLKFPQMGLTAMAIFMLVNLFLTSWLQKPMLHVFNRGSKSFRGGCGALLIGLGCYVGCLAHVFSLVILSAMILSLGEIFFISSLHGVCRRGFQGTLALSLMVGASSGATIYQSFGANALWQSCAYIGILCFVLVVAKAAIANTFIIARRMMNINKDALS